MSTAYNEVFMNHAVSRDHHVERPVWETVLQWGAALAIGILFLSSGLWKIMDPFGWSVLLHQFKVPQDVTLPFAVALGTLETFTGVLFLIPQYRRLAAWIGTALLLVFMAYIGFNYKALHGADCSCFPFVKRAVDPAFFAEDGAMIVAAVVAGAWARKTASLRGAALILGVVAVFAVVLLGVASTRRTGIQAPESITVNGKPYPIATGKVFVYFYDPECMHCLDAGERMAQLNWGDTKFVGQPVVRPQFAAAFMDRTGLKGVTASDLALLKKTFPYTGTPAAVAIQDGREVAALTKFDDPEPSATIKKLGFAK
jgi:uncharacterized membrane protein YphA (DoxX/SURF4 family)